MTNTEQTTQAGGSSATPAEDLRNAARETGDAAKSAFSDAKAKLGERGDEKISDASSNVGESLRQVADQLRQAGDGLGQDQAWAKQAFSQGAQGLDRVSGYLRDGRLDDFTRDLQSFARTNPAAFLAGSVAVGFLAARMAKTAAEHVAETPPAPQPQTPTTSARPAEEPRSFAPAMDGGAAYQGGL
ncbi:MAG: hypothetical protein ACK4JY_10595 [Brevundimonas sp.]|uniref:hypothetical protein n=1 Tax=Brevundimonas sp. TaxID=1871086 RepID=UPI00391D11C6